MLEYVSGWTTELHRQGYLAGVYAGQASGIAHLSAAHDSASYARPDAVWVARWDGSTSLRGWVGVPDSRWATRQRLKQYRGDHIERFGGVGLLIDSNAVDGPVATVAVGYRVTTATSLNARSGPTTSAAVVRRIAGGSTIAVVCQSESTAPGAAVGGTSVWDRLGDGSFVSDRYVSTPSKTTYSAPLPRCTYPSQVVASSLTRRDRPDPAGARLGSLPGGSLAWTRCQVAGAAVVSSTVWNLLDDGGYVADNYLITSPHGPFTTAVPRC